MHPVIHHRIGQLLVNGFGRQPGVMGPENIGKFRAVIRTELFATRPWPLAREIIDPGASAGRGDSCCDAPRGAQRLPRRSQPIQRATGIGFIRDLSTQNGGASGRVFGKPANDVFIPGVVRQIHVPFVPIRTEQEIDF